jgi:hypothetical protein
MLVKTRQHFVPGALPGIDGLRPLRTVRLPLVYVPTIVPAFAVRLFGEFGHGLLHSERRWDDDQSTKEEAVSV